MSRRTIYFATNRNPIPNAETASAFGTTFAKPPSNLRFGKVTRSDAAESMVVFDQKLINKIPDPNFDDPSKTAEVLGSTQMFREINAELRGGKDLILYIHGYNNSFRGALGETFALAEYYAANPAVFVLFSWPLDGSTAKRAYFSDRHDAETSGAALSRGLQKMAHFLKELSPDQHCRQRLHLVAHSMGCFALRHAVRHIANTTTRIRRIFDEVFLFAADEDADALSNPQKLGILPSFAKRISVYTNTKDKTLFLSDTTKGNPDRLGAGGPDNTRALHDKFSIIGCDRVSGLLNDPYGHHYLRSSEAVRDDVLEVLRGKQTDFSHRAFNPETRRYFLF
jgi:esterase/lipase superfamily enzyme